MEKDFYDILGLSEEEKSLQGKEFEKVLKDKYKKLALKWHPDKFSTKSEEERKNAEEKFKDISEAYNTLSDEKKRQQYDFQNGNFGGGGFSPFGDDDFADPFGFFRHANTNRVQKAESISIAITLTLKELYHGVEREVTYNRFVPCHHCNGSGSEDGKKEKCTYCNGTGVISQTTHFGNIQTIRSTPCTHCKGTGIKITKPCTKCGGSGTELQRITQTIKIEPGTLPGMKLVLEGGGSIKDGYIPGDLIIKVLSDPNDRYKLNNQGDVIEEIEVPFIDAILGTDVTVEFLSGKKEKLKLKELTPDGFTYTYYNKGFPRQSLFNNGGTSHIMKVKYKYPSKLTSKQRELLKKIKE